MGNNFVTELVNREFGDVEKHYLMSKISNWNKIQEYFDTKPELQEISNCLAIELQTKVRPAICKRIHQKMENVLRAEHAAEISLFIQRN